MTKVSPPPTATKRVFRVDVCSTEYLWILIEATSREEARQLAANIDARYYRPNWHNTDWEIVDAELASEYEPDQVAPPEAYDSL